MFNKFRLVFGSSKFLSCLIIPRFLEDGDLHSDNKRQRQFKWKGLDDSLEVDRRVSDGEEEVDDMGEGEQWRIQRLEREKWMKGKLLSISYRTAAL